MKVYNVRINPRVQDGSLCKPLKVTARRLNFNENCFTNVNDVNIIHCKIRFLYAQHDEFPVLLGVLHVKFVIFVSQRVG